MALRWIGLGIAWIAALATAAPVSYETKSQRAPLVIAELAAAANLKLAVSKEFANEPLTIRANQVEVEDLLARIAEVLGAMWRLAPDGVRSLVPRPAAVNQERLKIEAEKLAQVDEVRRQIADSLRERLKELPPETAAHDRTVAHARLLLGIPVRMLANIGPNERIVFSTSPNSMQRALPVPPDVWLAVAKSMSNDASDEDGAGDEPTTDDERRLRELEDLFDPQLKRNAWSGTPAKMLLIVCAWNDAPTADWQEPSFDIHAYDAAGALLDQDSIYLESYVPMTCGTQSGHAAVAATPDVPEGAPNRTNPAAPPQTPIAYSKEALAINDLLVAGHAAADERAELIAKMRRVDAYEPLGYGYGEALLATAKAQGKSLVACLPDDSFDTAELPETVELFLDIVDAAPGIVSVDGGGWRLIRPKHPELTRRNRVDRVALAAAFAATGGRDVLTLDMRAGLAAALGNEPSWTWSHWVSAICPNFLAQGVFDSTDWTALRLWGVLTKGQRESVRKGLAVPVQTLSGDARELARQMVFGTEARLVVERNERWPNIDPLLLEFATKTRVPAPIDVQTEPTEVFPAGLPAMASVAASVTREPVFAVGSNEAARQLGIVAAGLFEVAAIRALLSADVDDASDAPSLERARQGMRTEIVLKLALTPAIHVRHVLIDDDVAQDAPEADMSKLPADVEQRLRKIEAVLADLFRLISFKEGGSDPVPAERP